MAGLVATTAEAPAPVIQAEAKTASSKAVAREFQNLPERNGITAQEQDVQLVTLATVLKKGHELIGKDFKKGEVVTNLTLAEFYKKDKSRVEVEFLSHMLNPDFQDTKLTGEAMMVSVDGKKQQITRIKSRDGVLFTCEVGGKEVSIPVSEVLSAQIVSMFKSSEVRALFTADEMTVIEAHLDSIAGKPEKAGQVDQAKLKELALSSGLVATDSLKTFAEKNGMMMRETEPDKITLPADSKKPIDEVIAENKAHNEKVSEVLKPLEGRTVASPEMVATMIQSLLPGQIAETRLNLMEQKVKIELEKSQLKVGSADDQKRLSEITLLQEQIESQELLLKQAEGFIQDQDGQIAVLEVFGSVQRGDVEVTVVQALDKGLKDNSVDGIISAVMASKKIPEAAVDEIKKAIDYMKIGKIGGGISLGFFFMMLWKAISGEGLLGAVGK